MEGREGTDQCRVITTSLILFSLTKNKILDECWSSRSELYGRHLDFLKWRQEIEDAEDWLVTKEAELTDATFGSSIEEVDSLLGMFFWSHNRRSVLITSTTLYACR